MREVRREGKAEQEEEEEEEKRRKRRRRITSSYKHYQNRCDAFIQTCVRAWRT